MTDVESNDAISITTVSYWRRNLAPVCEPMRRKPKPNAPCKLGFSRAFSNLLVTARNSDCFIALFASVVIGRSSYVDVGFTTAN